MQWCWPMPACSSCCPPTWCGGSGSGLAPPSRPGTDGGWRCAVLRCAVLRWLGSVSCLLAWQGLRLASGQATASVRLGITPAKVLPACMSACPLAACPRACLPARLPLHGPACRSRDCVKGLGAYYRLAVPSTLMVCLEWWAYEFCIFMAGWLPNPTLSVASMGVMLQVSGFCYMLPMVRAARLLLRSCCIWCGAMAGDTCDGAGLIIAVAAHQPASQLASQPASQQGVPHPVHLACRACPALCLCVSAMRWGPTCPTQPAAAHTPPPPSQPAPRHLW